MDFHSTSEINLQFELVEQKQNHEIFSEYVHCINEYT